MCLIFVCFFHTINVIYPTYLSYYYYFCSYNYKASSLPFLSSCKLHTFFSPPKKFYLCFIFFFYISKNSELFLKSSYTLITLSVQYHLVSTWACLANNKYSSSWYLCCTCFLLLSVRCTCSVFFYTELCKWLSFV